VYLSGFLLLLLFGCLRIVLFIQRICYSSSDLLCIGRERRIVLGYYLRVVLGSQLMTAFCFVTPCDIMIGCASKV